MMADLSIQQAEHGNRGAFFIERQGRRVAELTYSRRSASLVNIDHTEVDPSLRGQGVARLLLDAAVRWARETQTRFTTTCPYATVTFARDPSIRDVLSPEETGASGAASCEVPRPNG